MHYCGTTKLSKEEQEKAYEELKRDFPEARNKELRRDQFDKILREEKQRIVEFSKYLNYPFL